MHLVEKHKIKVSNKYYQAFEKLSKYSNNLYNQALYLVKESLQNYQDEDNSNDPRKGWLFYSDLDKLCKNMPDNFNNYRRLPSQTAQQILRTLDSNLKSHRQSMKTYSNNSNGHFNYNLSKYKSILDKTQKGIYTSRRLLRMYEQRNNQITDYLHKISSKLVSLLVEKGTTEVIIGHNIHQKQGSKLKNFVQVPVFRFISLLSYKLAIKGIKLIEVEESYTSGTSFLDNEFPTKVNYNKVRRLRRGLFQSNQGRLINADVNAAYQIMRKVYEYVVPKEWGFILNPVRL